MPGRIVSVRQRPFSNRLTNDDTDNRTALTDDIGLCGGFLTWLTRERREWLSGRYISVNWDTKELQNRREEIVEGDMLKFRMVC